MSEISICPCGSGKSFALCCAPLLEGKEHAATAEQLMRSRYSAYVSGNVDYIINTTHPSTRKQYSRKSIRQWASESQWLKLEIDFSSETVVEFKAFYKDKKAMLQVHQERSTFKLEDGKWYFVKGE